MSRRPKVGHVDGSKQGDHSTAFGLIMRTLNRCLSSHYQQSNPYYYITQTTPPAHAQLLNLINNVNNISGKYLATVSFKSELNNETLTKQVLSFIGQVGELRNDGLSISGEIDEINAYYQTEFVKIRSYQLNRLKLNAISSSDNTDPIELKNMQDKENILVALEDNLIEYLADRYIRHRNA